MPDITLPILARLSYKMILPSGEEIPVPLIISSSEIVQPLEQHASKISSKEGLQLGETFDLTYIIQQGWQNTKYLERIDIIDPVFSELYGAWSVGMPKTMIVGTDEVLDVKYERKDENTLQIYDLNDIILPNDNVSVTVPIKILDPKAIDYLSQEARILLVYPNQEDNLEATVDSVPYLEEGTFEMLSSTTWPQGQIAVPGDVIGYSVQFINTRRTAIAVLERQFIQIIPEGTAFVGWGIDGKEDAPEGFTYTANTERSLLTNSEELTIQDQMSFSYAVRVVERRNG